MVLCELVLDRWCFKAYKSAAAVGQLRFIVDFKRKCLPYALHTNTSSPVYPEAERRSRRSLDPAWNLYLKSLQRNAPFFRDLSRSLCAV